MPIAPNSNAASPDWSGGPGGEDGGAGGGDGGGGLSLLPAQPGEGGAQRRMRAGARSAPGAATYCDTRASRGPSSALRAPSPTLRVGEGEAGTAACGAGANGANPHDPRRLRAAVRACVERGGGPALLAQMAPYGEAFLADWAVWARDDQWRFAEDWRTWLVLGGRGAGKTRLGAEWVRGIALGRPPFATRPSGRIALVGETFQAVRDVMIEGQSGLLAVHPRAERPAWLPSRQRLEWANGAVAQAFSAEDPDALRGPQFTDAWLDELAKWRQAEATWDMLQFALRLGERPRLLVTTTPRAMPLLKRLMAEAGTLVTKAPTALNRDFLSPGFLASLTERYGGTRLGRQELEAELIADRPDALWRREAIEAGRVVRPPEILRTVVAVDPPASSQAGADACGIVAVGKGADGLAYVLADASAAGLRPAEWAGRAAALYRRLDADRLVAEVNQGGEMVAAVFAEVAPDVPVAAVRAKRGKWLRAEPVAALYEQGRVRHVGAFPELEDELCDFGTDGLSSGRSPDRLDALVWAVTALLLERRGEPRVRVG
jgi:phage terminase large subunit-like protein